MSTVSNPRTLPHRDYVPSPRMDRPATRASSIDPIRVLRRHILGIVASAFIGGLLGVVAFFVLNRYFPLYSGEVLFEVRPGLQEAGDIGTIDLASNEAIHRVAQTETHMLTTNLVLGKALDHPNILRTQWHKKFLTTDSSGRQILNHAEALEDLQEDLRTRVIRNSSLFSLNWSAAHPEDVPMVLNAIMEAYLDIRRDRDREVYDKNLKLFEDQLAGTQRKLEDLAQNIQNLIRRANITTLEDTRYSAEAVKMQNLMGQLAQATMSLNVTQTQLRIVQDQISGTLEPSPSDILNAEMDPSLRDQINIIQQLKAEHMRMLATRQADDAMVRQMEERIKAMEAARDEKLKQIIRRNLEAQARELTVSEERLKNAVKSLDEELVKVQSQLKDLAADQSQYEAMKTRREHLEEQRTADMQLINEVTLMRLRADASRVREVQRAFIPREPSFPKPEMIIPLGVLLMVALTVGIVFARELLDQRVKSVSDLAVLPGAHVIGGIPDLDDDPTKTQAAELVVRKQPFSVLAESYRQASATLMPLLDRNGHQTLLLVGGLPGAGTTTVATNLAAAASAAGRKVLLIDANFRRPRLAEAMGFSSNSAGLGDLLTNGGTPDSVIIDAGDGISLLPAGTPASRVFDRLQNGVFDSLLVELRGRFDLIIFDAPPAVVAGEAMMLANKVDAAVLVVRANQEHRGLVARMINRFANARCELLGVLLNRPRGVAGGYLKKNYATIAKYTSTSSA